MCAGSHSPWWRSSDVGSGRGGDARPGRQRSDHQRRPARRDGVAAADPEPGRRPPKSSWRGSSPSRSTSKGRQRARPVPVRFTIAAVAAAHSADQAARSTMSHTGADGSNAGQRLTRQGVTWTSWGENVGAGFNDPATLLQAWLASPTHRPTCSAPRTPVSASAWPPRPTAPATGRWTSSAERAAVHRVGRDHRRGVRPGDRVLRRRARVRVGRGSPSLTNDGRPKGGRGSPTRRRDRRPARRADGDDQSAVIGRQTAGRVGFFLRVDDFEAAYERMAKAEVEFVSVPRTEPYGRVAVFVDIAGNRWDLLGPG